MKIVMTLSGFFSLFLCSLSYSDHHESSASQSLFHEVLLENLESANYKIIQLAEEFSEEQYDWRPAEGIRSVGESILHVAGGNYALGKMLGKELPEEVDPWELEKVVTGKENILETYRISIEFAYTAIEAVTEEDLATEIKMFSKQKPKITVVLRIDAHANEHLGQLIAYARSIGVVPPWSQ